MKIVLFANTEWYLWNFRRSLALALRAAGHDVLLISPDGPYGEKLRALGLQLLVHTHQVALAVLVELEDARPVRLRQLGSL